MCKTLSVTDAVLLRTVPRSVYICVHRFHVSLAMSQSTLCYVILCYAVNKFSRLQNNTQQFCSGPPLLLKNSRFIVYIWLLSISELPADVMRSYYLFLFSSLKFIFLSAFLFQGMISWSHKRCLFLATWKPWERAFSSYQELVMPLRSLLGTKQIERD